MESLIPANVVLGDRTYRIRIDEGQEQVVRQTVKLINDKILEFKTQFAGKDMQDYVAMVLLWFATTAPTGQPADTGWLTEQLERMDKQLSDALKKDTP